MIRDDAPIAEGGIKPGPADERSEEAHSSSSNGSGESSGLVGAGGDLDNIIAFRYVGDFPIAKREKWPCRCSRVREKYPYGQIPGAWIDEATMDLECKTCGARMTAFDYIWMMATEGGSLWRDIVRMREEKQALKAQIDLLNEQIRELKAEGRKLANAPKSTVVGGARGIGDGNRPPNIRACSPSGRT